MRRDEVAASNAIPSFGGDPFARPPQMGGNNEVMSNPFSNPFAASDANFNTQSAGPNSFDNSNPFANSAAPSASDPFAGTSMPASPLANPMGSANGGAGGAPLSNPFADQLSDASKAAFGSLFDEANNGPLPGGSIGGSMGGSMGGSVGGSIANPFGAQIGGAPFGGPVVIPNQQGFPGLAPNAMPPASPGNGPAATPVKRNLAPELPPDPAMRSGPDPYIDHLAAKVASLQAQKQALENPLPDPSVPSAFKPVGSEEDWHDAFSLPGADRKPEKPRKGVPFATQGEEELYGSDDEQAENELKRTGGIRSARVVAGKSESIVSTVRAFKEYIIPVLVLVIIAGFGSYIFHVYSQSKLDKMRTTHQSVVPDLTTQSESADGTGSMDSSNAVPAASEATPATTSGGTGKKHGKGTAPKAPSSKARTTKQGKGKTKLAAVQEPVQPVQPAAEKGAEVYATPDNALRFTKFANDQCELADGKGAIKVQYVVYDGSPGTVARQMIDSLFERQVWLKQTKEGMKTDMEMLLYAKASPDWQVLNKMKLVYQSGVLHFQRVQEYPKDLKETNTQPFMYGNPFTGVTKFVQMVMIHESDGNSKHIIDLLQEGQLVVGEVPFERGEIRCYSIGHVQDKGAAKGIGFFVRGADQNGNLFRVKDTGQVLVYGSLEGRDVTNAKFPPDVRNPILLQKPTKVWIAKNQYLPPFLLYHIVPLALAILAALSYWRSMMVLPGKDPNNPVNNGFRVFAYIALGMTIVCVVLQYIIWL